MNIEARNQYVETLKEKYFKTNWKEKTKIKNKRR